MKYASSLIIAATLLSSCVEPLPPPPPPTTAYCPPTKKKTTTAKTTVATPAPAQQPAERGRTVDGRFIRDTPPESLEPAKTLRVEKDF